LVAALLLLGWHAVLMLYIPFEAAVINVFYIVLTMSVLAFAIRDSLPSSRQI
jgi:hypothetical protein